MNSIDPIDDSFNAGVNDFTDYYRTQSGYDLQEGLSQTYYLKMNEKIIGYVSIAMAHLRKDTTENMDTKQTCSNIPTLLISHLATHVDYQKKGIGTLLLDEIFRISVGLSKIIGCRYIMLNPRNDEGVREFYRKNEYTYIPNLKDDKESDAFIKDIQINQKTPKINQNM